MSRRPNNERPPSVDALLPSFCLLGVNRSSMATTLHVPKLQSILEQHPYDEKDCAVASIASISVKAQLNAAKWVNEEGEFNHTLLLQKIIADNAMWTQFYPPLEGLNEEQYTLENFTTFRPEGRTKKIDPPLVPHWKNSNWPAANRKHETLFVARHEFLKTIEQSILYKPSADNAKRQQDVAITMERLRSIVDTHKNSTDAQTLHDGYITMFFELVQPVEGYKKPLWPRNELSLPPGWLAYYKPRSKNASSQKPGTYHYHIVEYIGPQYNKWDHETLSGSYEYFSCRHPKDAWLIYLQYQTGRVETNDLAVKGNELALQHQTAASRKRSKASESSEGRRKEHKAASVEDRANKAPVMTKVVSNQEEAALPQKEADADQGKAASSQREAGADQGEAASPQREEGADQGEAASSKKAADLANDDFDAAMRDLQALL